MTPVINAVDSPAHSSSMRDEILEKSNLTKSQLQIWMGQALYPDAPLYNMTSAFTIHGAIEPDGFQAALQALVDRSDALRSVFVTAKGIPQQRVRARYRYCLDYQDWTGRRQAALPLRTWLEQRSALPFNLGERLFDAALLRVAPDEHVWVLKLHHLIGDAWSTGLIFRHVAEYYDLALRNGLAEAPPLPAYGQYVDYERAYRRSPQYAKDEVYWRGRLAQPVEPLMFYGKAGGQPTTCTRRVTHDLGRHRSEALRAIARQDDMRLLSPHLSLFSIFSTVLLAYLHRLTGQRQLALGAPVHNRPVRDFRDTIGLLMGICPLRVEVAESDTFASLFGKVKAQMLAALPRARYSPGNPVGHRAYDVLLNYHTVTNSDFHGFPTRHDRIHSGHGDAAHRLALEVHDSPAAGGFQCLFDFNQAAFDRESEPRVVQHLMNVLDGFIADRSQLIRDIDLLSEPERRQLIVDWNATTADYPRTACLHHLFEVQAERQPDSVAVLDETEQLTYRSLNEQANRLAHRLQALGVGPGALVGICLRRSARMLVALLGTLKAGAAYVPMDPAFPPARLALMLADAQPRVLLTEQDLVDSLAGETAHVLCLDSDWPSLVSESTANFSTIADSGQRAYVIYTSGSTGQPKGVQVSHRAAVNFLCSMQREPGLSEQDVLLAVTTLSFDIALLELFLPLSVGARVVIVSRDTASDGRRLAEALDRYGVTVMQATPATWRMLLSAGWPGNWQLKALCGGEALPRDLADQLLARCVSLWNLYGPTETTVWSTVQRVRSADGPVPIGRPIANTQLYVLDDQQRPVPAGVPGELFIGGDGLALGYLNRPELTAEKFVRNPFSADPGARLYRTGDLVRYRLDGALEYLGRLDHQVKVRGYRIELGEIEAALAGHPAIKQAAVATLEQGSGDKRLVAYLVARNGSVPPAQELRGFLKARLPDYMLPAAFVFMEALPLTPNRKVDRRALPAPELAQPAPEPAGGEAQDDLEVALVRIWEAVLGRSPIGIRDDFFELGGDSLSATALLARIETELGANLPMASLLRAPTVAELAVILRQAGARPSQPAAHSAARAASNGRHRLLTLLGKGVRAVAQRFLLP